MEQNVGQILARLLLSPLVFLMLIGTHTHRHKILVSLALGTHHSSNTTRTKQDTHESEAVLLSSRLGLKR